MGCDRCGGAGWIVIERNGISGADRCQCSVKTKPAPPEIDEIFAMVGRIAASGVIPFFPQEEEAWKILAVEIAGFVQDRPGLELFGRMIIRHAKKYEGPAGLRQIYCAYLTPADGVYPDVPLPGFSIEDSEARAKEIEIEENTRRLESYRRAALAAPAEDRAPLLLPEPVQMAKPIEKPIVAVDQPLSLKEREDKLAAAKGPERSFEQRRRLEIELMEQLHKFNLTRSDGSSTVH